MAWQNRLPVIGGLLDNPEQEALSQQFKDMADTYTRYRGLHADAQQEGLGAQLDAFGPLQEYLSLMLPGLQPFDLEGMKAKFAKTADAIRADAGGVTGGQGPAPYSGPSSGAFASPAPGPTLAPGAPRNPITPFTNANVADNRGYVSPGARPGVTTDYRGR